MFPFVSIKYRSLSASREDAKKNGARAVAAFLSTMKSTIAQSNPGNGAVKTEQKKGGEKKEPPVFSRASSAVYYN